MRLLFLILFLLNSLYSYGQDSLIYEAHHGFCYERIYLLKDKKFVLESGCCTFHSIDEGNYTKENKELIFTVNNKKAPTSKLIIIDSSEVTNNNYNHKLTIQTLQGNTPLDYANVKGYHTNSVICEGYTDSIGIIKLISNEPLDSIMISCIGFGNQTFKLSNSDYSYSFQCLLHHDWTKSRYANGEKINFKIKREKRNSIYLINSKGYGEWYKKKQGRLK